MNYEQALEYVDSFLRFGIKPGLERIKQLLDMLGNPQNELKYIHVAGTNGKGSTCAFLSSILKESGLKVGLFTSPFILDFRERFQINEQMISQQDFVDLVEYIIPFAKKMAKYGSKLTEFEIITAIAFLWFKRENCDIVILEVGLGGRLDATNVIEKALVSVITSISYDHTNILGNTIKKIAGEKAGILKPGGTLVLYPKQDERVFSTIKNIAKSKNNKILLPDIAQISEISLGMPTTQFNYCCEKYSISLLGEHQVYNAVTAITVIKELQKNNTFNISEQSIHNGLLKARIPSRFEVLSERPLVILDGTHNPGGAEVLSEALQKYLSGKKIIALVGMLKDKDVEQVIKVVAPLISEFIVVQPENLRAMDKFELCDLIKRFNSRCEVAKDLTYAVQLVLSKLDKDSVGLVFGSLYLASQMRPILLEKTK